MIPIRNVYYMLAYAFRVLKEEGYQRLGNEKFRNTSELFAAILARGVSVQLRRGLGREYLDQTEPLSAPRGKIEISESIKMTNQLRKQLVCSYDDFSVNSYLNRILKTTMELLLHAEMAKERKKELYVWHAIGASRAVVNRVMLLETFFIYTAGALLGILLCAGLLPVLFGTAAELSALLRFALLTMLLTVLIGCVSTLLSVKRATESMNGQMLLTV